MRLDIEKLKASEKRLGTHGTAGTAKDGAAVRVPGRLCTLGTLGTLERVSSDSVPSVPSVPKELGTEKFNVDGAVPSVPSVPSENGYSSQDHTFWSDDFGKWALSECIFSDRCFGGVKVLHSHFCDWCAAQGTVGCMLETFEALLDSDGFLIAGGLVAGLVLRESIELDILRHRGRGG